MVRGSVAVVARARRRLDRISARIFVFDASPTWQTRTSRARVAALGACLAGLSCSATPQLPPLRLRAVDP